MTEADTNIRQDDVAVDRPAWSAFVEALIREDLEGNPRDAIQARRDRQRIFIGRRVRPDEEIGAIVELLEGRSTLGRGVRQLKRRVTNVPSGSDLLLPLGLGEVESSLRLFQPILKPFDLTGQTSKPLFLIARRCLEQRGGIA